MEEVELYHIHLIGKDDDKYIPGSTIIIGKNFNSKMNQRQQCFSQVISLYDSDGHSFINYSLYLQLFMAKTNSLSALTSNDLDDLRSILEIGYKLSYNADFFKRESSLEDYRMDNCANLPSRLHSMFLCDKDGLEYWEDVISNNNEKEIQTYKVLAKGELFKTNEQLLPNELSTYGESYKEAKYYWNPSFADVPNFSNEYLLQGQAKVLEKVNKKI